MLYGSIYEKSPAYNAAMTDWQTLAKASMSAPAAGAPGVAAILTPRGLGVWRGGAQRDGRPAGDPGTLFVVSALAQHLDGGTYDNMGLEAFDSDRYASLFLIAMNAGGMFRTGRWGGLPFIRNLTRSNSLLYRQSTGLRTRWMVDRFKASEQAARAKLPAPSWCRQGVLMTLASQVNGSAAAQWRATFPEERTWQKKDLAFVPTVFDRLDRELCRLLVYRGWWLTGATIVTYPGLAPPPNSAPPLG